jgi:putative membrane protein
MMWGYGFNWPSMGLMMLGSTLWVVLLAAIVWAVIRWLNHRTTSPTQHTTMLPGHGPTAREILNQRYARGEIDATTFEQMRERLEASDNAHMRSWEEVPRPTGESLFDSNGRKNGSEVL